VHDGRKYIPFGLIKWWGGDIAKNYQNDVFYLGCLHPVACVRSGDGGFYIRLRNVTIVG
jgi:hypothetical protein